MGTELHWNRNQFGVIEGKKVKEKSELKKIVEEKVNTLKTEVEETVEIIDEYNNRIEDQETILVEQPDHTWKPYKKRKHRGE